MKLRLFYSSLLAFILLSISATSGHASYGIFGYGVEINATAPGAVSQGLTLYAFNNSYLTTSTDNRLLPSGSAATLDSNDAAGGNAASPTFSLGNFNPLAGDTLTFTGAAMLTFENGADAAAIDNTQIYANYAVEPLGASPSFPAGINLPLTTAAINGVTGDNRFSNESQSINLLSGTGVDTGTGPTLTPGTYVLVSYGYAGPTGTYTAAYAQPGSFQNYGVEFTVVPEPATWSLLAAAACAGLGLYRLRRRA